MDSWWQTKSGTRDKQSIWFPIISDCFLVASAPAHFRPVSYAVLPCAETIPELSAAKVRQINLVRQNN
jgi:hypothetical protein